MHESAEPICEALARWTMLSECSRAKLASLRELSVKEEMDRIVPTRTGGLLDFSEDSWQLCRDSGPIVRDSDARTFRVRFASTSSDTTHGSWRGYGLAHSTEHVRSLRS
jgi:hypothetical protein